MYFVCSLAPYSYFRGYLSPQANEAGQRNDQSLAPILHFSILSNVIFVGESAIENLLNSPTKKFQIINWLKYNSLPGYSMMVLDQRSVTNQLKTLP
jgi:hypothetical protein